MTNGQSDKKGRKGKRENVINIEDINNDKKSRNFHQKISFIA